MSGIKELRGETLYYLGTLELHVVGKSNSICLQLHNTFIIIIHAASNYIKCAENFA